MKIKDEINHTAWKERNTLKRNKNSQINPLIYPNGWLIIQGRVKKFIVSAGDEFVTNGIQATATQTEEVCRLQGGLCWKNKPHLVTFHESISANSSPVQSAGCCRIYQLHLYRGIRPPNECPEYDIKHSDGPVILDLWGMQRNPL